MVADRDSVVETKKFEQDHVPIRALPAGERNALEIRLKKGAARVLVFLGCTMYTIITNCI